jgi:pimeloyl-ACP methyl ester carboxylesterase
MTNYPHLGRMGLLYLLLMYLLVMSGCAARELPWGERTIELNRTFLVDDREDRALVYRDNEAAAPYTLMLLHGLAASKAAFMELAPRLAEDYRVISVDLLGHGDSSKTLGLDYSTAGQARALLQLVLARDLRALVLIGSSYGGTVALELALQLDQIGQGERVLGVVAVGAPALYYGRPLGMQRVDNPLIHFWATRVQDRHDLARALLRSSYYVPERIRPEQVIEYARPYDSPAALAAVTRAARELFDELASRVSPAERYSRLQKPVLLIWGRHDRVVPLSVLFQLRRMLPQARWRVVNDSGHTPQEERPAETEVLVRDFLSTL